VSGVAAPGAPRRRFCFLTTFYPPASFGGDALFVRDLARELVARGHEVDVLHNVDAYRVLGGRPVAAEPEPPGLTVHRLASRWPLLAALTAQQSGGAGWYGKRLRALLARPFDVVHFHNLSLAGGATALELAPAGAVRLYTTHEAWLVCPTHSLFRFGREHCERPTCFACTLASGRPPQLWRWGRRLERALGRVDAVVAPSRSVERLHRERGLDLPFVHLPNFVPHGDGPPPTAASPAAPPRFLFAGRIERLKGLQTLLPAFARLGPAAELWVAGDGSDAEDLRRQSPDNVRWLGRLPQPELRTVMRAAVATIVPSLCHEVCPLIAIESLRDAVPLVVPRRGALPELVETSDGGRIYDDEAGLETALRELLAAPEERHRLARSARAAYLRNWTPEVHLERYLSLVEQLAESRPAAQAPPRRQSTSRL